MGWRGPVSWVLRVGLDPSNRRILAFLLQFKGHHGPAGKNRMLLTNHSMVIEASPWGSGKEGLDSCAHLSFILYPTHSPRLGTVKVL
jgi:hypothetical protein